MPMGGLIPYDNDVNERTREGLSTLLTPYARERLGASLRRQPEQYFPLPADVSRPTSVDDLAKSRVLGRPEMFNLLLQLLQSQRA